MQRRAICTLVAAFFAACGGDGAGPAAELPAELVGTWEASPACVPDCGFTFTNATNAADSVNFTAAFGTTSRLTLNPSGTFTFSSGVPLTAPVAGRMELEGNELVVQASGEFPEERIRYSLQGGMLRLEWDETFSFDLDENGTDEDVRVRGVFERQ